MPLSKLTESVRQMLPPKTFLAINKISSLQKPLDEAELAQVTGMGQYRQQEFTAGRAIAKEVMSSLGINCQAIPRDGYGCPIWPTSVVGSISHKGGFCGALVTSDCNYKSAGFDIEFVEGLSSSVWSTFTSKSELEACSIKNLTEEYLANILFCTKEACFKALFPLLNTSTPPLRLIIPTVKTIQNQTVISFNYGDFLLSGGLVWDNRAILAWILTTKKV